MSYPISVKRHEDDRKKAEGYLHKKHGGRTHHHRDDDGDDDTASHNIHIVVNGQKPADNSMAALGGAGMGAPMPPPPPPMAPPPGPPPMGGMPGAGPGGPPPPMGPGAGPGPIAMRRGGRAKKDWGGAVAKDSSEASGAPLPKAGTRGAPLHRAQGGRTQGGITSAQSQTDGDKIHPDHGTDTSPARKARGGQLTNQSGGGGGGLGRLRKAQVAKGG
jgi:hypothetical protein